MVLILLSLLKFISELNIAPILHKEHLMLNSWFTFLDFYLLYLASFPTGCYNGSVYVLKSDSGEKHWVFTTEDAVKSSAALDLSTGLLYIGSHDQHAYALDVYVRLHLLSPFLKCRRARNCPM